MWHNRPDESVRTGQATKFEVPKVKKFFSTPDNNEN